jgi:hypothetical protein
VSAVGSVQITVRCLPQSNALPVAHTCFCELDVPAYSNADVFNAKLKLAMYGSATFDRV